MWVGSPYKHAVTPRGPLPVAEAQVLCAPPGPRPSWDSTLPRAARRKEPMAHSDLVPLCRGGNRDAGTGGRGPRVPQPGLPDADSGPRPRCRAAYHGYSMVTMETKSHSHYYGGQCSRLQGWVTTSLGPGVGRCPDSGTSCPSRPWACAEDVRPTSHGLRQGCGVPHPHQSWTRSGTPAQRLLGAFGHAPSGHA